MPRKVTRLFVRALKSIGFVDAGAVEGAEVIVAKRDDPDVTKREWDTAYINDLPDSAFAVVESGGEKDDQGKTTPRALRHLPYRNSAGNIDLPHLRNALGRLPQSKLSPELKTKARNKLDAAAKEMEIGEFAEKIDAIAAAWAAVTATEQTIEKVGAKMSAARLTKLSAALAALQDIMHEVMGEEDNMGDTKKIDIAKLDDATQAHLAATEKRTTDAEQRATDAEARLLTVEKELAELKAKAAPAPDDVWKGVSPEVRKRLEDAEKRAKDAESLATAERDQRVTTEYVEKVRRSYKALPVKPEAFGPLLKRAAGNALTAEDLAEIERVLKAADAALISAKAFTAVGYGSDAERSAADRLRAAAEEIRKTKPELSPRDARIEARKRNPELAREERDEQSTRH